MDIREKVKDFDELVGIIKAKKKHGKKVILAHGVFDLMHPGHIRHFEAAKKMADILVVTLTKDEYVNKGPGRPVFNHRLRAESIAALSSVDYVAVNKWPTAVETILHLKPDMYVKGSEYREKKDDVTGKIYDEEEAISSVGGKMVFTDDITFSSSELLNQHFSVYPKEADIFLKDFKRRYSADDVIGCLKGLKDLKVLVVGDVIIDEYIYCQGMGKPAKDDIISTRYIKEERFTGGALAVSKHVANFAKEVHLVSVLGEDNDYEDFISENISPGIKTKFFYKKNMSTVVKRRYLNPSFMTKMFEINFVNDAEIEKDLAKDICGYLDKVLLKYDLVIVSDFGHGFINGAIVDKLCKKAKFLSVNAQTNSANMGYNLITKYKRADFICIDEPEIRLAMHSKYGRIEQLILELSKKLKCPKVIITRGHLGSMVYEKGKGFKAIPVFSKEIVDRVGAGDAFLSVTSPMVAKGRDLELVGFVGNTVGALAVLIVGNRTPVESVPLFKFVKSLLK